MACPTPYPTLKIPGATGPMVALSLARVVWFAVATRSAGPEGTVQGTWKLTWVLETNKSGAEIPPTVKEKPPRLAGRGIVVAWADTDAGTNPTPNRRSEERRAGKETRSTR